MGPATGVLGQEAGEAARAAPSALPTVPPLRGPAPPAGPSHRGRSGPEMVECRKVDGDRYGRVVARCTLEDGTDLGAELVPRGLALDYERYSGGVYADEQEAARKAGAGAWQGEFTPPWDWRRR